MFAVDKGHKDIVQRLVSAGADVHIRDEVCGGSVCQMLDVVPNGLGKILLYNSTCALYIHVHKCTVLWTRPFSRITHVHEEKGKGREGH